MNLARKLMSGIALTGLPLAAACEKRAFTEPEEFSVSGRILWDHNKDGKYEASPGASVFIYNLADSTFKKSLAEEDGRFFFTNFPSGEYTIQALKFSSLDMHYEIRWISVAGRTNVGDMRLKRIPLIPLPF